MAGGASGDKRTPQPGCLISVLQEAGEGQGRMGSHGCGGSLGWGTRTGGDVVRSNLVLTSPCLSFPLSVNEKDLVVLGKARPDRGRSWKHRVVRVGRGLRDHFLPPPHHSCPQLLQNPLSPSNVALGWGHLTSPVFLPSWTRCWTRKCGVKQPHRFSSPWAWVLGGSLPSPATTSRTTTATSMPPSSPSSTSSRLCWPPWLCLLCWASRPTS